MHRTYLLLLAWGMACGLSGCAAPGRPDSTSLTTATEEEDDGLLDSLAPSKTWKKFKAMIGQGPNENVARQAYAEGETLFRQAHYKEAAAKYTVAYERWPDSPLEEDALMKAAESHFFCDQYPKADDTYALLVKKYPNSQYLDRISHRRFNVAKYWQELHNAHPHWPVTPILTDKTRPVFDVEGHALRVYERVRLDDPTGPLADDSIMTTAISHFQKRQYEDADYYFTLLRTEYPKSEHQYKAHVLGLQAKLLKYQGPDYEGKPLEEARELVQQILTQFPNESGPERERIVQTQAEIRAQLALRDFQRGEYYQKGQYYGASRMYYAKIIKEYPETKLAKESLARIEAVRGQPDDPKPAFEWLVKVLPESKKPQAPSPMMANQPGNVQR